MDDVLGEHGEVGFFLSLTLSLSLSRVSPNAQVGCDHGCFQSGVLLVHLITCYHFNDNAYRTRW